VKITTLFRWGKVWPASRPESIPAMGGEVPVAEGRDVHDTNAVEAQLICTAENGRLMGAAEASAKKEQIHTPEEPAVDGGPVGLQRGFERGERLPWKGIWFRVARVDAGMIALVPESMTMGRAKKNEEARHAR
jgi:hypothetical protein